MRIVIDMQGAQTGSRFRGIGRYTLSLVKAMVRKRGQHEIILALSGLFPETLELLSAEFDDLLPKEDIRIWYAPRPSREEDPANRYHRIVAEKMREAFMAQLHPDVVLITTLFDHDAICSIGRLNETLTTAVILYDLIPLINPDEDFLSKKHLQDQYADKITSIKRSHILLAISESARQEALTSLHFDANSVVTISGACSDFFQISPMAKSAKNTVLKKLGISKPFIMYTGGADQRKNLNRLIMAYSQLPNKVRREHQLVFVGKMEGYVQDYQDTAKRCGLDYGELVITEYIEDTDLLTLYNTCKLFVFPSTHEGFGLPPLEAMACGAPVIGSDASSLPEVIGLKEALFDPLSVPAISAKIKQALTDNLFRDRLQKHGLAHFRNFSWDESATRALNALERFRPRRLSPISPLLTIEKTSIFEQRPLKILAIKLDHLGDFLLAIPAFSKLKAKYPYATIDLIVGSWNASIAKELGIFDTIFTYDFFKKKSSEPPSVSATELDKLLASLGKYDIAIDFRRQRESRFLLVKTNARLKVGYQTLDQDIDRSLDVSLRAYIEPSFIATPLNKTSISRQIIAIVDALPDDPNDFITFPRISRQTKREKGAVAIFPKAGTDAREWEASNFVSLVDMLLTNELVRKINIYFANQNEANEFDFNLTSKLHVHIGLKLTELSESLSKNEICVANNSGGAHLAAYLGVTSIGLYSGHELPSEWAPQFNHGYVIQRAAQCAPCHVGRKVDCPNGMFCLNEISVSDVYETTIDALGKYPAKTGRNRDESAPKLTLHKNADSIVHELIDSVAEDINAHLSIDPIEIAVAISKNHPTYPVSAVPTTVTPNALVNHNSGLVVWEGFSGIEPNFRWTDGHTAEMRFIYPEDQPQTGTLVLVFDTLGKQRIIASLNGLQLIDEVKSGSQIELAFPVSNLQSGANRLSLSLPDARMPDNGYDKRTLAIAVRAFKIVVHTG